MVTNDCVRIMLRPQVATLLARSGAVISSLDINAGMLVFPQAITIVNSRIDCAGSRHSQNIAVPYA